MKFCNKKIQKHLLNGGKIKKKLETYEIILQIDENGFFRDNDGDFYQINKSDIAADNWVIVEPRYNWNKIIKDKILCQFWDEPKEKDIPYTGFLDKKTIEGFYKVNGSIIWKHCKPFNPKEFNIAKNIKEYEK